MNLSKPIESKKPSLTTTKLSDTFVGLGDRYFNKLKGVRQKILQVDACNGITETAGSMLDKSISIAIALRNRHVVEGDRVIISSRMNLDLTPTILGIWYIGAIACPIDPNMDMEECTAFFDKLHPKVVFADLKAQGYVELALKGRNIATNCEIIVFGQSTVYTAGTDKIFCIKADETFLPNKIMKSKLKSAFIVPSEGAYCESKLVDISHYAMLCRSVSFESHIGKRIDRVLCFFPFATFPNLIITCSALEEGVVKILSGQFSAKYTCRLIHDLKVDLAVMGTDIALKLASYIKSTKDFDLSCLKGLIAGLMTTSAKDIALIKASFPRCLVMNVYGCVECGFISGVATPLKTESRQVALNLYANRFGSLGRAFNKVRYKIVDLTSGEPVGSDCWGEMLVGGPGLMMGYYGDRKATRYVFQNGYYKTGDIVQHDEEEFLFFGGRINDQVVREGVKSYLVNELEEIVLMHPKVKEVAVVCEPIGNTAFVVLNDSKFKMKTEDIQDYVSDLMPEFKRLDIVYFVDALPKTSFGKVQKYKLRSSKLLEVSMSSFTIIESI